MRFKKTSLATKLLLLTVAVYAIIRLVSLQSGINAANAREQELQQQVYYAEQEQHLLEQSIEELGTDKSTVRIARERLGMVEEGEIVFYDSDD